LKTRGGVAVPSSARINLSVAGDTADTFTLVLSGVDVGVVPGVRGASSAIFLNTRASRIRPSSSKIFALSSSWRCALFLV